MHCYRALLPCTATVQEILKTKYKYVHCYCALLPALLPYTATVQEILKKKIPCTVTMHCYRTLRGMAAAAALSLVYRDIVEHGDVFIGI